MQDLARTIAKHHFARTIEAVKLEFDAMATIGIVPAYPLHELAIRIEPAEAVAKAGLLHCVIRCWLIRSGPTPTT